MAINRQGTKKTKDQMGGVMIGGAMGGGMQNDEYAEKSRPNLFNVIKKLKE